MNLRLNRPRAALALTLVLLLSACPHADRQLAIAAKTNIELQKFAIAAEQSGQMSTEEAKVIIDGTARVGNAGLTAVAIVERIRANDPNSKTAALDALGIVADELIRFSGSITIKSDPARHQVESLLLAIQASLNAARVVIAAGK